MTDDMPEPLPPDPTELMTAELVPAAERLALLLDISRAAASLDLPALIDRLGSCLQRSHWNCDHTSLLLYDPAQNVLRVHDLFFAPGPLADTHRQVETKDLIPIEGTQSGRTLTTGRPCVTNSLAEYVATAGAAWTAKVVPFMPAAYSSGTIPLTHRGRPLGVLAFSCARDGAFTDDAVRFLSQIADIIAPAVDNVMAYREIKDLKDRLAKENQYLSGEINAGFGEIVGSSPALRSVLALIDSVARTDSTVLISGETGTGKELVAQAIHQISARRDGTFVKLNCAAIPSGLLESELFGYQKGAFTGAAAQKVGRFELAHRGTLFLDEVGELSLDVQPKLLRVLEHQEFERLGGTQTLKVDTRLIAATNRDLAEMRARGSFRSDLYYRLNVVPIQVPPLRERAEDIPLLVHHFVQRFARRLHKVIDEVPTASLAALGRYEWPGNVRELANVIERAVILSPGPVLEIHTADLAAANASSPRAVSAAREAADPTEAGQPQRLVDLERALITRTLEAANWIVGGPSGAAVRLGLSRTTLQARIRRLGITRLK